AISNEFGGALTVSNSTFTDNQAVNGLGTVAVAGAILSVLNSPLTVSGCTFTGNQVQANGSYSAVGSFAAGGAIFTVPSTLSLSSSTFTDNQAIGLALGSSGPRAEGGALYCERSSSTVSNCTFNNNVASGGFVDFGGAIELDQGTTSITNSTF